MNGERIAAARKAKGMSQRRLGELVGVSQQAISKYESPNGDIDGDTLISLAAALGVTISYLLGLTDEPGPTQVYETTGYLPRTFPVSPRLRDSRLETKKGPLHLR